MSGVTEEGQVLQRLFSTFPDGWAGVGLLLLRLVVSLDAFMQGIDTLLTPASSFLLSRITGVIGVVLAVSLLVGFLTPLSAAWTALIRVASALSMNALTAGHFSASSLFNVNLFFTAVAVLFLGPGAFSLDARIFGRREIIIPDLRRPPSP